eukprot:964594-Pleurochrysis_carterae.AAC.1
MFTAVVKLHFVSATAGLAIALIHTYWLHGSRALGLAEHSNPMLVSHVSRLDFDPAFDRAVCTIKLVSTSAPELIVRTVTFIDKVDEQLNDAAMDFAFAVPLTIVAHVRQALLPARANVAATTAPCQRRPRSTNVSAPISSCSRALIAS